MDPFVHHTNQTLLLQRENFHNTINELAVESLKFEAEQQNYIRQSSIFITGHAFFQILEKRTTELHLADFNLLAMQPSRFWGSQVKNMIQFGAMVNQGLILDTSYQSSP